jgi:hypothetical protein
MKNLNESYELFINHPVHLMSNMFDLIWWDEIVLITLFRQKAVIA